MRGPTNQEPTGSPLVWRRVLERRQHAHFAALAQEVCKAFSKGIAERQPDRRWGLVPCGLHPLTAVHHREVVMMTISVWCRGMVIMVVVTCT